MNTTAINPAELSWSEQGTPVSRTFGDPYFSVDQGPEETAHVFLNGNRLPARFHTHPREIFVTAETGFGTGLNFLMLWRMFDRFQQQHPDARLQRLHVISVEKYPLTPDDLLRAHAHWPELADYAATLRAQWPAALAGCHRLLLDDGRVTLDLWLTDINALPGDVGETLNQQIDAWFLDGFSPAKNPDMWTPALFTWMARLARDGCTFATFTAAGFVRRGLAEAGFHVEKSKGFAAKREMLIGIISKAAKPPPCASWPRRCGTTSKTVSLIGGGIASAFLALALLRRGWEVTLYCADSCPAMGASGNRQGALYPLLNRHDPALTAFFPAAFTFARRLLDALNVSIDHSWCGVTQLAWDSRSTEKINHMLAVAWPETLAYGVNAAQAEALCGVVTGCGGITYPQGGWLSPAQLTSALFERACQKGLVVHWQHRLTHMTRNEQGWTLAFSGGAEVTAEAVVLATGHELTSLPQSEKLPAYAVSGQVSHLPTTAVLSKIKQVLCYDGYLTPVNTCNGHHCIGASYHRGDATTDYREADQQENRQRLIRSLPAADWPQDVDVSAKLARVSVRCATRDHLPMVGPLPDVDRLRAACDTQNTPPNLADGIPVHPGLFVLGALGSRGLCSAPLAAEVLAAGLCGEPLPLDNATLAALHPGRFWIRKLLKGKAINL